MKTELKLKSIEETLIVDNCKTQREIAKSDLLFSKPIGKGRPKKNLPETILITSIRNITALFKWTEQNQPSITEELFLWLEQELDKRKEEHIFYRVMYSFVTFYWSTGMRPIEGIEALWDDLTVNELRIRSAKKHNGEKAYRYLFVTDKTIEELRILQELGITEEGYMIKLSGYEGTRKQDELFKDLTEIFGLNAVIEKHTKGKTRKLCGYHFRRGRIVQFQESDSFTISHMKDYLGHKDFRSLKHYTKNNSESMIDLVKDFDNGIKNPLLGSVRINQLRDMMNHNLGIESKLDKILKLLDS